MTGKDKDDPDPDRTLFGPLPGRSESRKPDPDATQFMPIPAKAAPVDPDATQFIPISDKAAPVDPDATQLGAGADPDPDATQFMPMSDNAAPVDPDAPRFGDLPDLDPDPDATQFAAPLPVATTSTPPVSAPPVSTPPASVPPQIAPPATAAPKTLVPQQTGSTVRVGTLINNNYEVKEVLKSGGMGEVYRGENVFTGDPVAIKVVLPELAEDEKVGLMFMREARTLSQLSDEAIVRYYNFVKDPEIDRYCLIMEFIKGTPLSDHTATQGPISVVEAKVLLKRLAKGLDKAHARGVIHRDLSPDNVMLPHDVVAEALLIDFGIAKSNVLKEGTMAGQFAGKFKYVSPEQLGDFGGTIGPATDIYGLALLIAAALLGKPLDMGSSIFEAVQARQSIPDLTSLPDDFRPLLGYMLEPDPVDRPASMEVVGRLMDHPEDIPEKYRAGLPPLPRKVSATTQTDVPGLRLPPIAVGGLQQPPMTSRVGGTLPPEARRAQTNAPAPLPQHKNGPGVLTLLSVVFVAALGAAGLYAWNIGLIGGRDGPVLPDPETADTIRWPRQDDTRDGFLAGFDTGACTYATRIDAGPNAGMVAGFAATAGAFSGLPTAYEEKFGARPTILDSQIAPPQCAVLDLVRGIQGTAQPSISMQLDVSETVSGGGINGRIDDPLNRNIWLVLISPRGTVFSLNDRLSDSVGGVRTFRFGLTLAAGAPAAPQLLLAIAGEQSLATAATALDGTQVSDLAPLIAREIIGRGGDGVAALSFVMVTPAPPTVVEETDPAAVEPEPATDP